MSEAVRPGHKSAGSTLPLELEQKERDELNAVKSDSESVDEKHEGEGKPKKKRKRRRKKEVIPDVYRGYLMKKSPHGLPGFRVWQKRWFEICLIETEVNVQRVMRYFREEGDDHPLKTIPLSRIVQVRLLPKKRTGGRFDVTVDTKRTYCLDAQFPSEARRWVRVFSKAIEADRQELRDEARKKKREDRQWTALQRVVYELRYGKSAMTNKVKINYFLNEFEDDLSILRFILNDVLNPWDVSSEKTGKIVSLKMHKKQQKEQEGEGVERMWGVGVEEKDFFAVYKGENNRVAFAKTLRDKLLRDLARGVKTERFLRTVHKLFTPNMDPDVADFSVRIVWIVLHSMNGPKASSKIFDENAKVFYGGLNYNIGVKRALMAILMEKPEQLAKGAGEENKYAFHRKFTSPHVLPAFVSALKESPMPLREATLKDLNMSLINCAANCLMMGFVDDWQARVLDLLTDVPRLDKRKSAGSGGSGNKQGKLTQESKSSALTDEQRSLCQSTRAFVLNIFAVLHFSTFNDVSFLPKMQASYDAVFAYAGPCSDTAAIFSMVLVSLVTKLTSSSGRKLFAGIDQYGYAGPAWRNLRELYKFARKYMVQCRHLQDAEDVSKSSGKQNLSEAKQRRRGRTHVSSLKSMSDMQLQRMKFFAQTKRDEFMLYRVRNPEVAPNELFSRVNEPGFHFNAKGECMDKNMCVALNKLLKVLKFDRYDADDWVEQSEMKIGDTDRNWKEDQAFARKTHNYTLFLTDLGKLFSILHEDGLSDLRLSWTYMSRLATKFLASSHDQKLRHDLIEEAQKLMKREITLSEVVLV